LRRRWTGEFYELHQHAIAFLDYAEHGRNFQPKSVNMQLLIERNGLQSPVYIGDTDSDSREAAKAGVPFVLLRMALERPTGMF